MYVAVYTSVVSVEILLLWGDDSCSTEAGKEELSICRNLWTSCLQRSLLKQHITSWCNLQPFILPLKFFVS